MTSCAQERLAVPVRLVLPVVLIHVYTFIYLTLPEVYEWNIYENGNDKGAGCKFENYVVKSDKYNRNL